MKEVFRGVIPERSQLTIPRPAPRLEGGDLFMGEPSKEVNKSPQQEKTRTEEQTVKLREEWRGVFTPKELENPDTRSAIEAAISLGYGPTRVVAKGLAQPQAREVVSNALLVDQQRLTKAGEVLDRGLTEEQQNAILKAHRLGEYQMGRNEQMAGIYNYTQGQLLAKARILRDEGGFNKEEIRKLMEAGIVGRPILDPIPRDFPEPLERIVEEMNEMAADLGPRKDFSPDYLERQIHRVQDFVDKGTFTDPVDLKKARDLIILMGRRFGKAMEEGAKRRMGEGGVSYFYIEERDKIQLRDLDKAMVWLDAKFDLLYTLSEQGQELDAPTFEAMQRSLADAARFIEANYEFEEDLDKKKRSLEVVREFNDSHLVRINLLFTRAMMGLGGVENVQKAVARFRAEGLFKSFNLQGGRAGQMFNRMHELLEDERLKLYRHHVTPELANRLQNDVLLEQWELAKKGAGMFTDSYSRMLSNLNSELESKGKKYDDLSEEEKDKFNSRLKEEVLREIRRAVRTGFDLFIASQRMAVVVARGRHLFGLDAYFSDPWSGPLNVYNLEDLLWGKFKTLTGEDEKLLNEMKLDMAEGELLERRRKVEDLQRDLKKGKLSDDQKEELVIRKRELVKESKLSREEKLDLGRKLVRDMFLIPDFFTSGWRMKGVLKILDERLIARFGETDGARISSDLALFMRVRINRNEYKGTLWKKEGDKVDEIKNVWERIAEISPDEIVRIFREYGDEHKELKRKVDELFRKDAFRSAGINNYDEFKEKFGGILRALRERALIGEGKSKKDEEEGNWDFRVLRIGADGFTEKERKYIDGWFKDKDSDCDAGKIQAMFREMSAFGKSVIPELMYDVVFADIGSRTLLMDDVPVGWLEKNEVIKFDGSKEESLPLSKRFAAANPGADALVRMWNDTASAVEAGQHLGEFLNAHDIEEKFKASIEFARKTNYNGVESIAKCVRYTSGTLLNLSKMGLLWDVIGIEKGLFRMPISEIERIMGPHAKPLDRDQLREHLDKLRPLLLKAAKSITPEEAERIAGMSEDERKKYFEKREKDAMKIFKDLEQSTETTAWHTVKRRTLTLIFYLLLLLLGETIELTKGAVKDSLGQTAA